MEKWQAKALEYFPELQKVINQNQFGPSGLWDDLYLALVDAYDRQPINEDLIRRIYDYAFWCFNQPQTGDAQTDLSSAASVGLMENLPLDRRVSGDLYRWLSVETFESCEKLFRYHLSDEEYRKFSSEFLEKKRGFRGAPRL